jgi:hypothetical protein
MYFVIGWILWLSIDEQFKEELGIFTGLFRMIIYTIIYIILFVIIDYNWIDIYHWFSKIEFKINL